MALHRGGKGEAVACLFSWAILCWLLAWPRGSQASWSRLRVFSASCGFHRRLLRRSPTMVVPRRGLLLTLSRVLCFFSNLTCGLASRSGGSCVFGLFATLRRMHWSKEAPSYGCVTPYWSTPAIKLVPYRIIGTVVEAIIRWWCCHIGGNSFTSRW